MIDHFFKAFRALLIEWFALKSTKISASRFPLKLIEQKIDSEQLWVWNSRPKKSSHYLRLSSESRTVKILNLFHVGNFGEKCRTKVRCDVKNRFLSSTISKISFSLETMRRKVCRWNPRIFCNWNVNRYCSISRLLKSVFYHEKSPCSDAWKINRLHIDLSLFPQTTKRHDSSRIDKLTLNPFQ